MSLLSLRVRALPWATSLLVVACADDSRAPGADGAVDAAVVSPDLFVDASSPPDAAADVLDACDEHACAADDAADDMDAQREEAGVADAAPGDAGFTFSYGPCPAPLSCDALIAVIAWPLLRAADPNAPDNVSACIQPGLLYPAVPACYALGPCMVDNEVGICLGMEPPHPNTGYCLKPCR